jgi:putative ABC transport system permease protein
MRSTEYLLDTEELEVSGSDRVATRLGAAGAFVTDTFARDRDLKVGSRARFTTPAGNTLTVHVAGIIDEPTLGSPLSGITISKASFDKAFEVQDNRLILVNVPGGASQKNTGALRKALAVFPGVKMQTAAELKESELAGIASMLNILYALLGISIVVSLFGLVNTLVLSVFERTRELGMLKAIGMTPRQVRRMIRHESVVTSLLGATLGLTIGGALAAATSIALTDYGIAFAIPVGTLVTFVLVAIAAGMAAAILPARRASRLNVLAALQHE